jgi:hypothetical protein
MEEVQLALGARYRTVRLEINAAFIVLDVEEVDLLHAVVYPYCEVWICVEGGNAKQVSAGIKRGPDTFCKLFRIAIKITEWAR